MRFDFSSVDDVESYVSVPAGPHRVRVAEVREGVSREGATRWTFRLEVIDGDYAGRTAAWDSLTWSERGVYRVKKVLEALGLDVRGELEVEPNDLVGLRALVTVTPEEREDPVTGRRQVRMRVPYLGYAPLGHDRDDGPASRRRSEVDGRRGGGEPGFHGTTSDEAEDERPF